MKIQYKIINSIIIGVALIATLISVYNFSIAIKSASEINTLRYNASKVSVDYGRKEVELDKKYKIDNSINDDTYYNKLEELRIQEREYDLICNGKINNAELKLVDSIKSGLAYGFIAFVLAITIKIIKEN